MDKGFTDYYTYRKTNNKQLSNHIKEFVNNRRNLLNLQGIEIASEVPLKKLVHLSNGQKKSLSKDVIEKVIPVLELVGYKTPCTQFTVEEIFKAISYISGYHINMILKKTRKREILEERQIAMFFCKELNKNNTLEIIGEKTGYDSKTVLHSYNTVLNLYNTNKNFKEKVDSYKYLIKYNLY